MYFKLLFLYNLASFFTEINSCTPQILGANIYSSFHLHEKLNTVQYPHTLLLSKCMLNTCCALLSLLSRLLRRQETDLPPKHSCQRERNLQVCGCQSILSAIRNCGQATVSKGKSNCVVAWLLGAPCCHRINTEGHQSTSRVPYFRVSPPAFVRPLSTFHQFLKWTKGKCQGKYFY